jgi:hypothetical protein
MVSNLSLITVQIYPCFKVFMGRAINVQSVTISGNLLDMPISPVVISSYVCK